MQLAEIASKPAEMNTTRSPGRRSTGGGPSLAPNLLISCAAVPGSPLMPPLAEPRQWHLGACPCRALGQAFDRRRAHSFGSRSGRVLGGPGGFGTIGLGRSHDPSV